MASTFGERVRRARDHARLSQVELARRIGIKQQAIEYLENPNNAARASRYTADIARITGVDAGWLAREEGPAPVHGVRAPGAAYGASSSLSTAALEVASSWSALSDGTQAFFRDLIFLARLLEERGSALRAPGRTESFTQWAKKLAGGHALEGDDRRRPETARGAHSPSLAKRKPARLDKP